MVKRKLNAHEMCQTSEESGDLLANQTCPRIGVSIQMHAIFFNTKIGISQLHTGMAFVQAS